MLTAAAAANMASWHDLHVRALGFGTQWRDGLWLTTDRVPGIFFRAIAIRPGASATAVVQGVHGQGWSAISDPWSDLDLTAGGYQFDGDHPWMVREPGTDPGPVHPDGLIVERVVDAASLADFERVAAIGFGSPVRETFVWHAPPVLLDPRLGMWRGRLGDRTVGVAMSFLEAGVVGVYGVTTLPDDRRRGYGAALTRQALMADPTLPAVLQPSSMAESMYARLGFTRFATFRSWGRSGR